MRALDRVELCGSEAESVASTFRFDQDAWLVDYEGWPRQVIEVDTDVSPLPGVARTTRLVILAPMAE